MKRRGVYAGVEYCPPGREVGFPNWLVLAWWTSRFGIALIVLTLSRMSRFCKAISQNTLTNS
jgi:hypothetical protein